MTIDLVPVPCSACQSSQVRTLDFVRLSPIGITSTLVRCRSCGLVYVSPRPTREAEQALYAKAYYETADQEVWDGPRLELFRRLLAAMERRQPHGELLDVGCGKGHFLKIAGDRGWGVTGIEPSHAAGNHARQAFGLRVLEGEAATVELPPNYFNVIVAWNVIDQLYDPAPALERIYTWLRPGGWLGLRLSNVEFHWRLHRFWPIVRRLWPKAVQYREPTVFHLTMFSPATIIALLRRVGWQRVMVRNSPLDPYVEDLVQPLGRTRAARLQRGLYGAAQCAWACSLGRWVVGPSLLIWARKPKDAKR
ncbi:MAG: class I SAM-dependent methyltransferase [Candidatus Omnitrophica bacterium]|nr:class I SAM-dependent methyltransferase [Candidatus Omnitrophota bacterium]